METPTVLFEDQDILVVVKPAGMIVNRADTTKNLITLQEWVENYLKIDTSYITEESSDFLKRAGIVHRLDKETSGILVVAKNEEAFKALQAQFKEGKVEKVYIALCHGNVIPEEGEIRVPIGRLPWNRTHFGVFPQGRESRTLYKVLKRLQLVSGKEVFPLSLIEAYPKTGRTHQIRVHFQYLGFPLFADELYAGRKTGKKDRKLLSRHFLHAKKISFFHPTTRETLTFEASLPDELQTFLDTLTIQ